ncbi:hypothetical protein J3R30DRAFT_3369343 [Lentinula aciculospora]|uniref:Uncharacterized protein n=1 Tax=Lentinula aciculospora TaxID=153920 RepID=A0A9W9DRW8_9AGAR|nr:hypothetical protein J3R30DRAFT_3369343 [Lentinula aciculospora]
MASNTDNLMKSLPPTPSLDSDDSHTTFEDQRAILKPTKHHVRVSELPTVAEPPALATGDRERPKDPETEDLGWSENPKVPVPVVQGLDNEHLWILVRRFNKQVFHFRRISNPPPGVLDCTSAITSDSYSPDKLRSALERLYLTIIVGAATALKHIARIRSWTEASRTAWFCIAYFLAWYKDMLTPALFSLFLMLVVSPASRLVLFPPAPLAAINISTGGVTKPSAGHLGSKDSMTGAQEQFRGEAVEKEADHFVTGLSTIAVSVAVGKEGEGASPTSPEDEVNVSEEIMDAKVPNIADVASAVDAQRAASTVDKKSEDITSKQAAAPVQQTMWDNLGIIMSALTAIMDVWEMIGNALASSPPFRSIPMRARVGSPIALLLLVSLVLPEYWVYKGITLGSGLAFFGQPIYDKLAQKHILRYLDQLIPQWRRYLDIRNTILLGAPTDNQLTLTLLRLGETNKSPLPPPPATLATEENSDNDSSSPPPTAHPDDLPPEYSEQVQEIHSASQNSTEEPEDENSPKSPHKSKGSKLLNLVKGTTKAGVDGVLGLEKAKAVAGSKQAKSKTGIVQPVEVVEQAQREDGPSVFRGKWKGKQGVLTVSTTATQPLVAFSKLGRKKEMDSPAETVIWSLLINDIAEVRKVGGFGWKGKMIVGWSTGDQVIDGLEIIDMKGNVYLITALPRRDELFNRLVSIGNQRWESC